MEIYSQQILTRKNEEIAKVAKEKLEMEVLLRRLEAEKMELKRITLKRRAMVITLHTKLEEEKERVTMLVENDAESSCGEKEEVRAQKHVRREKNLFCSKYKTHTLGVLVLPCRHLSSCKACNALLQTCPICGMAKKGIIEIQNLI
ncbi:zinc finger, C3HC4 type (RING finger) protein [Medicago truncatula]|uniref:Zinc finger, C3HC4 type (RING finger) protein n=2 Tax=Medicago truncatula TaxID=3880 RepID=G7JCQ2_MEDTR|nr:zinc finger, C3HC4 type (RING finger) protein [Medicago truncatula]